jgi:segregation and condensation protein B
VEAALLAADEPLGVERLMSLFDQPEQPTAREVRAALDQIARDCGARGIELQEVASGFRFQVKQEVAPWVCRLWEQRPTRYSRALIETLSIIAYRQPVSRGEIEDIRGVTVSTAIVKTLLEHEWVRVVGHREAPGRPALYGTTRRFLDYFGLRSLDELPTLAELVDPGARPDGEVPAPSTDPDEP